MLPSGHHGSEKRDGEGCSAVAKKAEAADVAPVASLFPTMPLTHPGRPLVTEDVFMKGVVCVLFFSGFFHTA